jgi:hypothetical protein
MNKVHTFATHHPIAFCLAALLAWMFAGGITAASAAALLKVSILDFWPQKIGSLGATFLLLLLVWRMGWLKSIGLTKVGRWQVWLVTALALLYLFPASLYGFFGEMNFDFSVYRFSEAAQQSLLSHLIVGFVVETLFGGIMLYALIRAWGHTRRGILAAVFIQAMIFGVPHLLQIAVGGSLSATLVVILISLISATWYATLVLRWGSLWPVILIHAVTNNIFLVKGLSNVMVQPEALGYIRAALAEFPLLLIGVWGLMRVPLREAPLSGETDELIAQPA